MNKDFQEKICKIKLFYHLISLFYRSKISSSWYTSTSGLIIAGAGLLILVLVIVLPTVLIVILTRNPKGKIKFIFIIYSIIFFFSVVNNSTTTTVAPTVTSAYWGFDSNANDMYGVYNGVILNGAAYSNNTYFGYGYNLQLNASVNQSVTVSSPFFNLSYTSFTVEAWIYGYSLTGDNSIFCQCQCSTCQDQCLYLIIRNYKMYMGFTLDDIVGSTSISINTWYHIAYVYDYSSQTQSLYIQGILDTSRTSAGPYQGQNGSIIIGSSQITSSPFNGFIDNLKLTTRAKSATEILADASVVVYFSFDGSTVTQDMGPNQMNGSLSNAAVETGKVGQGLVFSGSLSFFQAYGFYQLGQSNKAFSFALWVYPFSVTGGTLIHLTVGQFPNNTWCVDMMGFTYAGQIAFHTNGASSQITGPFVSTLQWTHIVFTYSNTDGQTMYINGVQYLTANGTTTYSASGSIDWLTIGYNFGGCSSSPISGGYYFGIIDEFYVYRRELSASDAYSLANP